MSKEEKRYCVEWLKLEIASIEYELECFRYGGLVSKPISVLEEELEQYKSLLKHALKRK